MSGGQISKNRSNVELYRHLKKERFKPINQRGMTQGLTVEAFIDTRREANQGAVNARIRLTNRSCTKTSKITDGSVSWTQIKTMHPTISSRREAKAGQHV